MLSWLDDFWSTVSGAVGRGVSDAIHWAEHAIAGLFLTVFSLVGSAWARFVNGFNYVLTHIDFFSQDVALWATWIIRHVIPSLSKWALAGFTEVRSWIDSLTKWAAAGLAYLGHRIDQAYNDIEQWVVSNVYDPIKAYADQIWNDLKQWGYTAWYYITHPAELAELLIMPLVTSLENHAWDIAERLGEFTLALILKNLSRLLTLAEDIITAVF